MAQRFIELTEEELTGMESGAAQAPSTGKYIEMTDEELNAPFEPGMIQQAVAIMGGARGDEVPRASGFLAQARDLPIQAFKGAGTGVRMLTDIFGANNPVSKAIAGYEDTMDAILSAESRQDSKEMSRILNEAKDKGIYDQVIAGLQAISKAPLETTFNVAGIMIPTLAAGAVGKSLQLGAAGLAAAEVGIGALQGAGNIKGQIYQAVVDELRSSGETDEEKIHKVASEAQAYNGKNLDQILIGAGLGAAAATTGAESALNRVITKVGLKPSASLFSSILKGGITESIPEGAQAAQEQLSQNLALQRMGKDVPLMRGVVSQATMEAVASLPLGGFGGAVEYYAAPKPPPIPKPPEVQEQEDIERQANIEASRLMTPTGDRNAEAVLNRIQQNEQAVENLRGSLSTLEPTSPGAASLRMEINARQDELATLRDLQIRLGREIAQATGVSVPIMEAPIVPTEVAPSEVSKEPVTPVTRPTPTEAPAEPTISEKPAISELVGAEPIAVVEQEQVATAEAPTITPTPVAETPATTPAPEVAPAKPTAPKEVLDEIKQYPDFFNKISGDQSLAFSDVARYLSFRGLPKTIDAKIRKEFSRGGRVSEIEAAIQSEREAATKKGDVESAVKSVLARRGESEEIDNAINRYELEQSRLFSARQERKGRVGVKWADDVLASKVGEAQKRVRAAKDALAKLAQPTPTVSETITPAEPAPEVAPANPPKVNEVIAVDRKNNTEFALVKGLLPERPDMFSIGIRLIGSTQPFESGGYGHNTNKDRIMQRFFEKERTRLQDIEVKNQYFKNILSEEEAKVSEIETQKAAEKIAQEEQQRVFNEQKSSYEEAISKVKLPTGKSETMRFTAPDGSERALDSTRYGNIGIRKVTSGKKPLYNVDHWHSGLRITQVASLSEAKKIAQAIIASGADISSKDIKESELEKMRPVVRYFVKGGSVPQLPAPAEAPSTPSGISVGSRVKGKGPQTYIVEEVLTPSQREAELGEQYYLIRNERTGEVGRFESKDIKPVKAKGVRKMEARVKDESLIVPEADRYTFEEAQAEANKLFGGIPEGFVIVSDTTNPDYEFKAGYDIDNGNIIVNLAYIKKGESVRNLIAHELGHYAAGDPAIRAQLQAFLDGLPAEQKAKLERFVDRVYNKDTGEVRLEEKAVRAFVVMLKKGDNRNVFQKLLDTIKRWLNEKLGTKFQITDMDAAAVLSGAVDRFRSGEKIARQEEGIRKDTELSRMDNEYLDAVERGDMETAQRMVDEAAKKAGYNSAKVMHGTSARFNQFDKKKRGELTESESAKIAFFFTDGLSTAQSYAERSATMAEDKEVKSVLQQAEIAEKRGNWDLYEKLILRAEELEFGEDAAARKAALIRENSHIYQVYLKGDFLTLDAAGNGIISLKNAPDFKRLNGSLVTAINKAKRAGKDGVQILNFDDSMGASEVANHWAVFDPSQIKSADPVTYDDAGNVIPLSQRFQKTSPDIRRAAVDRYEERSQVGGIPGVGAIKSTPVGIKAKTRDIVRTMFNSDTISQANTNRAWNLINRFAERNPESNANLSSLNQMVRESMADEASEEILQSIGGPTLQNELFSYAIKLAGQGDKKILDHLLENPIVVSQGGTASTIGRDLGALGSFSSWLVNASQAERSATIEVLASRLFNTKSPTPEQIAAINTVLNAVKDTKINLGYAIEEEVKEVSEIIGTDIGEKIQSEIAESNPKLDPFAQAMLSLIQLQEAGEDIDFTVMVPARKELKLSTKMEKMVRDALAKYQSKMGAKGATGLEATFWKTLSSQEEAVGPLADLDMASNRNLAKIVKEVLKKYGLVGTPPKRGEAGSEKLSDIQLVASILTNTPLSKEKVMRADAEITAEIERRYNEEKQAAAGDQTLLDAIEVKYNTLRQAWGEAMGNQLDIPVSEAAMRRLLASEMKEKKIKLRDIIDKPTKAAESQAKRDVVASVIKKMVSLDPQADPNRFAEFEEKLNDIMDNMVATNKAKTKADTARQTIKDTANQPDRQAESAVRSLARMQGDVLDFGKAQPNEVRKIVSNDLQNTPNMGRKQAWKSMFVASLQQAGVSETIAMTLSDLVWRQHEINNLNKQIKQQENAVTKGPISTIVDAILNTPLGEQQDPKWRENVILQYLVDAGIPSQRASNIAKLFDAAIAKRFAEAQTKAAQKAIAGLKTLDPESKRGFDKLFAAIRAQSLNPASNPVREFAKQMGFKEFSGQQLQRLSDLDTIINKDESTDAERARAVSEVQNIINEVALPPRVRDVLSSFYVGQALMRVTTALIQVVDPAFYSATNAAISSFRNATSPTQIGQIWGDYTTSLFRAFREFAFSFQNDINRSGKMVDFLETQETALIRMNRQAQKDLESGNYAGFVKNTLFGSLPRFTFRLLKALDDAAFSILRDQSLNQYMVAAMNAAKIPKDKQIGVVRTALQAREIDRQNLLNQGMTKTEATVFSNERMKVYVQQALSGVEIKSAVDVVESAINDALSRIGKPRYATDPKTEKEQEIKDLGTFSYPLLKLYELTSQSANQMKGLEGEIYRIFVRTLLGFPVIASRVFNVAAGYTPLTLYRHLIKGRYPLTYGTALQRKQRIIEQFSLTLAVLPLLTMYRGSDDDDKKGTYVNFTGAGPSKLNKEFYAQWHKRNEPYSMQLVVDGKSRFTLDAKNSGPFSVMIYILGAYDDWAMNRRLKDEKTTKDDFRKAEEKMTWVNDMLGLLGTFILTSSRRGPTSSVMQGLVDWRRFPDNPLGALASEASFSLLPLVPIVGTGLAKNISDLLSEPIDTTTLEGAIANNIPFVPQMLDKPALNGYGQKLGELRFSEKLKKSTGIPFTFVQFDNENDRKLTDITMKFGVGPSEVSRNDVEVSLQRSLTDEEWRGFVKSYGEANAKMVLENYDQLYNMSREAFVYSIREAIAPSAKFKAYADLENQRKKK